MHIEKSEGRLTGQYTVKDLKWMREIVVPPLAAAIAMSEASDDDAKFGETLRFAIEWCIFSQTVKNKMCWLYTVGALLDEGAEDWQIKVILMIQEANGIIKFLGRDDKKAFKKFLRIKGVPMREEFTELWHQRMEDDDEER